MSAALGRYESHNVTLLGAQGPGGVTFAFTERSGGVSQGVYASLNLGDACGDNAAHVDENRSRALAAIGAQGLRESLVNPRQVHGSHVVVVNSPDVLASAKAEAREGADAIVCTCPKVPVLLCYADCVPVVLVGKGGFAVVHSGWRGTLARVAAKAARTLAAELGCDPQGITAYVGPHIREADYEVSPELVGTFRDAFGTDVSSDGVHLNLGLAVAKALAEEGIHECVDAAEGISTPKATERFFSYRASGGECGRIGAIAVMGGADVEWEVR